MLLYMSNVESKTAMRKPTAMEIADMKDRYLKKRVTKTGLAIEWKVSSYQINKWFGCGYKPTGGKRGRKVGWRKAKDMKPKTKPLPPVPDDDLPELEPEIPTNTIIFKKDPITNES